MEMVLGSIVSSKVKKRREVVSSYLYLNPLFFCMNVSTCQETIYTHCVIVCIMKEIRMTLEDWEHEKLLELKGELSWHDYLCKELK